MNEKTRPLSRRTALKGAASLIGGSLAAAQLGPLASRAAAAAAEDAPPAFFGEAQFELLERLVDLVIPETDTPGARGAGVHYFIDLMMSEWASPARQQRYVAGLEAIDARAAASGTDGFLAAAPGAQLDLLRALDGEAFATGAPDTFFKEFKRMVLFGYYSSEAGATVELRYEPIPGRYRTCVPIDDIGRAWFWLGFSHGL